jgi:hypothetical protein
MSSQPSRIPEYHDLNESKRFRFNQGRFSRYGLAVVHADTQAAHKEAVALFVDIIRDIADELATHPAWQMEVIDETGKPVFRLRLVGESLP